MPAYPKGPWFRSGRNRWYGWINGRAVNLGANEEIAREKFAALMVMPARFRHLSFPDAKAATRKHLRRRYKDSKHIEAAAKIFAEGKLARLGIRFQSGTVKASLVSAFRETVFADPDTQARAAEIGSRWAQSFRFYPDGWMVRIEGELITVVFLEIEHCSPMGLKKLLAYSALAADLQSVGGILRLFITDRYGNPRELEIISFGDCLHRAGNELAVTKELNAVDGISDSE